jgi:quinoprotein glucose dehydrogenase
MRGIMTRPLFRYLVPVALLAAALWTMPRTQGQSATQPSGKNGEWTHYTADVRGSKYMPLDQINASNFGKLEIAWRFSTANLGPRPEYNLEGTPLMVKGVVYATGGGGGSRGAACRTGPTAKAMSASSTSPSATSSCR